MSRRDILRYASYLLGGIASTPMSLYAANADQQATQTNGKTHSSLHPYQKLISVITEMIIPTTDTPGAVAAGVPDFINLMLSQWYTSDARQEFLVGLAVFDKHAIQLKAESFVSASDEIKMYILSDLDQQDRYNIFSELKELTVFGYYTSEVATLELNYSSIPTKYQACVPLDDIGRAWLQYGI